VRFKDLSTGSEPASSYPGRVLGRHLEEQLGRTFNVGQQQPAGEAADLMDGCFGRGGVGPHGTGHFRAVEGEAEAGHFNSVAVGEAAGLGDAAPVQVGAIGATQVDEPDFGLVLDLDESVLARDFGVRQDHLAGRRASQETTALDVDPLTARRFQPD
jgi:hypothetical protein